jgi:hypothetical protein
LLHLRARSAVGRRQMGHVYPEIGATADPEELA